jgi:hypothetical protein
VKFGCPPSIGKLLAEFGALFSQPRCISDQILVLNVDLKPDFIAAIVRLSFLTTRATIRPISVPPSCRSD